MGINELPITNFKRFAEEHGEKKSQMKVSWTEYIKKLNQEKTNTKGSQ